MEALGEDILLLSVKPDGTIVSADKLRYALAGSELVRLAAMGRVDVAEGRIVVLDAAATGDAELDSALAGLAAARRSPKAKQWVGAPRKRIVEAYQARLAAAGVVRGERRKALGIFTVTRWLVLDVPRAAEARARLDAVARSAAPVGSVDSAEAALGGLAHAVGLDAALYPGKGGRQERARLKAIAKRDPVAGLVQSAVDAAVRSATDAAVHAAIHASVDAAHHAASSHGGHDGGGGGHH